MKMKFNENLRMECQGFCSLLHTLSKLMGDLKWETILENHICI